MKKPGIERQMLVTAVIPLLVLVLLLEIFLTYTRLADQDQALFERAKLIAKQLALSGRFPVLSSDHDLLRQQVELALAEHDVNSVIVLDANNHILASGGNTVSSHEWQYFVQGAVMSGKPFSYQDSDKVLWLYYPILETPVGLDEEKRPDMPVRCLGSVIVKISKNRLNHEKLKILGFNLLLVLLTLCGAMFIALRAARRITVPVLEMNRAIRRIAEGHLDTRIPAGKIQELDVLATGINDMAHQLQQSRANLQQQIEEATRELHRKKEEAEKANADKSLFLAAASHNLRQPIHALGLFLEELNSRLSTPEQRQIAHRVEESVEAMSSLLNALLDISRLDAGVVVSQMQPVNIQSLVTRLVQDFMPLADRKHIVLHARCIQGMVLSDPALLELILRHLLSNAIRYTSENGKVFLACRRRGNEIHIEVRDNGIGIPAEEQQSIFHGAVRFADSAHNRNQGIGLGLAIVGRLARLLYHPVHLRSAPGRGSTFTIIVPRILGVESPAKHKSTAVPPSENDGLDKVRILVVDDDVLVRAGTISLLESWGCQVSAVGTLAEARKEYDQTPVDFVVCDYRLPDGDGFELADYIRQSDRAPPDFILVSGDTGEEVVHAASERNLHVLHKPIRSAKLRSLILFLLKKQKG